VSASTAVETRPKVDTQHYEKLLLEPYTYINQVKGKGVRSQLVDAFDTWLQVPASVSSQIKAIVEDLHQASLLVDDIEDNSTLRRGQPVAHHVFGVPATINCGNYIYFVALDRCHKLGNPEATQACIEEMLNLHRGQGMDMYWRDSNVCPTEDEYKHMTICKTGALFKLAVKIMQAFSENKTDLTRLVELLGVYFQIMDDYLNLYSPKFQEKKSFCEDFTEGKYSFPILHSIRIAPPGDTRLSNILKQKTEDIDLKKYAVSIMEETGSFEYTRQVLDGLKKELYAELAAIGSNDKLVNTISFLASQMESRKVEK